MEKQTYRKLKDLSKEEKDEHRKKQSRESRKRTRERQKARLLNLDVPAKQFINEGKTEQQRQLRKKQLDKSYREQKKNEKLDYNYLYKQLLEKYSHVNELYIKRYLNLVTHSFDISNSKTEKHHILPKSLFPLYSTNISNTVLFPIRVHYIAHKMLTKMYPNCGKMAHAYLLMSDKLFKRRSKDYELARTQASKYMSAIQTNRVKTGAHHLLGGKHAKERIKAGTHHFLGSKVNKDRVLNGTHNLVGIPPWKSLSANENSLKVWKRADVAFDIYITNPKIGFVNLKRELKMDDIKSRSPFSNMIKKFRKGWIPQEDKDWVNFKSQL